MVELVSARKGPSMTVDEKFAMWVSTKRKLLLTLAREAEGIVFRARAKGETLTEFHEAQEEYSRRLKNAAEALGAPAFRQVPGGSPSPKRKPKPRRAFPRGGALQD